MINNSIPSKANISKKFYITYNGKISQRNINTLIKCIHDYLEKEYGHLYLLICSDGGDLNAAIYAYNYIANQTNLMVTTHNTGLCGSAANMLFLTGQIRYACEHSYFLFHEINITQQASITISQAQRFFLEMNKIETFQSEIYKSKMDIGDDDLWKYCRTETYLTSKEAIPSGLISDIRAIPVIGTSQREPNLGANDSNLKEDEPNLGANDSNLKEDEPNLGANDSNLPHIVLDLE